MTDRIVFAQDLDPARALAEDGSKAYVKVDGTTVGYDASGNLKALGTHSVTAVTTDGAAIATISIDGTATDLFDKLTTIVKDAPTCSFTYKNELGQDVTVSGADFLSQTAGNSLIIDGNDGGLYFAAQALLNDDQVFSGDNTGSITFTLTPTTIADPANPNATQTNYTIKGVIQLAPTTASGLPNAATLDSANRLVVDPAMAQAGLTATINTPHPAIGTPAIDIKDAAGATLTSIPLVLVENIDGTIKRGWVDLS